MDLGANYEIYRTAEFILSRNFTRVALQVTLEKSLVFETLNPLFGFRENEMKRKSLIFWVDGIGNNWLNATLCLVAEKLKERKGK